MLKATLTCVWSIGKRVLMVLKAEMGNVLNYFNSDPKELLDAVKDIKGGEVFQLKVSFGIGFNVGGSGSMCFFTLREVMT